MKQEIQEKCQLFVENKNMLDKKFVWDSAMIMPVCAMLYAQQNRKVDVDKLEECRKQLKGKVGVFSNLRNYGELVLLSKMAMSEDSLNYLEQTLTAYSLIKKYKMSESAFTALAAMVLVDNVEVAQWEPVLGKAQRIYTQMKKDHPFLTGTEDVTFAILMAMSDLPEEWMMREMEECYKVLSKTFGASDGTQSLSHMLTIDRKDTTVKCEEVLKIHQIFKAKKKRFESNAVALYASLCLLDVDYEVLLEEIIEVDEYLKKQKGFGVWGIDARQRFMYASILVMNQYHTTNGDTQLTMLNSTIAAIIAQYTALIVTLMVATTVATTSN